jgi:hypothetical protein
MEVIINLKNITSKEDIIFRFNEVLKLHTLQKGIPNWDSFEDDLRHLGSDSKLVYEMNPKPENVHLVIKNIGDVKKFSVKEYAMLYNILSRAADQNERRDGISFTFDVGEEE